MDTSYSEPSVTHGETPRNESQEVPAGSKEGKEGGREAQRRSINILVSRVPPSLFRAHFRSSRAQIRDKIR